MVHRKKNVKSMTSGTSRRPTGSLYHGGAVRGDQPAPSGELAPAAPLDVGRKWILNLGDRLAGKGATPPSQTE